MVAEARSYDSGVVVKFNEKAYANESTTLEWLKQQYRYASETPFELRPRLLVIDVYSAQKTPAVLQTMADLNTIPSMIPGGCTGYIQPLDVAFNKPLKDRIRELAEQHYDDHAEQWDRGKYTVGERRIMLTKWVGQAWRDLHITHAESIRQTFRQIGLSLAIDGSEGDQIKIRDLPGIQVGNWAEEDGLITGVEESTEAEGVEEVTGGEQRFVMVDEVIEQQQEGVEQHDGMDTDSDIDEILYFDSSSSSSGSSSSDSSSESESDIGN